MLAMADWLWLGTCCQPLTAGKALVLNDLRQSDFVDIARMALL